MHVNFKMHDQKVDILFSECADDQQKQNKAKNKNKQTNKNNNKKTRSTPTNFNTGREVEFAPINMDYCRFQFDDLKFVLGIRLHGGSVLNFNFLNV